MTPWTAAGFTGAKFRCDDAQVATIRRRLVFLQLDQRGPLHAQLTRALRAAILDGRIKADSRLPSTRDLSGELGLSRTTVLAAFEQLRAEGFISCKVGSGSYASTSVSARTEAAPISIEAPASRFVRRMRDAMTPLAAAKYAKLRYNMQYGAPLINPSLTAVWSRELAKAALYAGPGYPNPQGLTALREAICDYLALRRGVRVDAERVLIVNGTQQALTLCAQVLLDEGEAAALEEPRYFGAYQVFTAHGAKLQPVRTDSEGMVCSELPTTPPKLVFVTPSHQFPGGSVMSLSRRAQLLQYAHRNACWIVEDDYDSEFRYDAHPLPALRAIDENDRVIYIGTFSKSLLGSLRLGYMVLPATLCSDFVRAKWLCDMGSSSIEQLALSNFIRDGGFERHLHRALRMLKTRRAMLVEALRKHAGDRIEIHDSHAGMHLVAWLRDLDHTQCQALIEFAFAQGLGLYSIATHYFSPPPRPGLLLGYAGLSPSELQEAAVLLGRCLQQFPPARAHC